MNFLRQIFFGIVQIIELPVNVVLELWRLPGRGRGLLFGFPAIFVLILTLLAIGWAKYGSNQDLIDVYWRAHHRDRATLNDLNTAIGLTTKGSSIGEGADSDDAVSSPPAANTLPEVNQPNSWLEDVVRAIEREVFVPELAIDVGNPHVVVRAHLDEKRAVKDVEVVTSSNIADWDLARRPIPRTFG